MDNDSIFNLSLNIGLAVIWSVLDKLLSEFFTLIYDIYSDSESSSLSTGYTESGIVCVLGLKYTSKDSWMV